MGPTEKEILNLINERIDVPHCSKGEKEQIIIDIYNVVMVIMQRMA